MRIKGLIEEDFVNYKKPSMYIAFPTCSFKCDIENGGLFCHNSALALKPDVEISKEEIAERYINNPITEAIVIAGLEPFDSALDLLPFIHTMRENYKCNDPIIIYTGYTEDELNEGNFGYGAREAQKVYWKLVKQLGVIVKFGRYRPNEEAHLDPILGVKLTSSNQYAKEFKPTND